MMTRSPSVAGYFYPGSAAELNKMLAKFIDKKAPKVEAAGLLVPHAGYQYSGAVTGAAVSRINFKDTFVIIGPTHSGMGEPFSVMPEGKWETPLGTVDIDSELAWKILDLSQYAREDYLAHREEHAVEVQIPFLQYINPKIRIVPMILTEASLSVLHEIGHAVAGAIRELSREAVILASGDMSHYEPAEQAREKDMKAVEAMLALDEEELTRRFNRLHITMCAHAPLTALMTAVKELGATEAELVKYRNSGDVTGDYSQVVGYAGVIFKKGGA